jgi:hypothetical protein
MFLADRRLVLVNAPKYKTDLQKNATEILPK